MSYPEDPKTTSRAHAEKRTEALRGLLTQSLHAWDRGATSDEAHFRRLIQSEVAGSPGNSGSKMSSGMGADPNDLAPSPSHVPPPPFSPQVDSRPLMSAQRGLSPSLLSLVPSMVQELWEISPMLTKINPSRRDHILQHLQTLAVGKRLCCLVV